MHLIRTASFANLFGITFAVAASFQLAFSLLGLMFAIATPRAFNMNGVVTTSPLAAMGVLLFLTVFSLCINVLMSAAGALIVLVWRRFLPKPRSA